MNPAQRNQLLVLDRALVALLDERVRLVADFDAAGDDGAPAALDDLLRRHDGPFPARDVRAVFGAIEAGCERAREDAR